MTLDRNRLRRLGRANPKKKKTSRSLSPAEIMLDRNGRPRPWVLADEARRQAEAAAEKAAAAEKTALPPEPAEATVPPAKAVPADPQPAVPQTPPPEPPWHEEMCRWRPRGEAEPYYDDGPYETIHEYDPLEEEDDYDWDD